jgi:hypothetical protein
MEAPEGDDFRYHKGANQEGGERHNNRGAVKRSDGLCRSHAISENEGQNCAHSNRNDSAWPTCQAMEAPQGDGFRYHKGANQEGGKRHNRNAVKSF